MTTEPTANDKPTTKEKEEAWRVLHAASLTLGWIASFENSLKKSAPAHDFTCTSCHPEHKPLVLNEWAGWALTDRRTRSSFGVVHVFIHNKLQRNALDVVYGWISFKKNQKTNEDNEKPSKKLMDIFRAIHQDIDNMPPSSAAMDDMDWHFKVKGHESLLSVYKEDKLEFIAKKICDDLRAP